MKNIMKDQKSQVGIKIKHQEGVLDYIEDINYNVSIISIISNDSSKLEFKEVTPYVKDVLYLYFLDIDETDKNINRKKLAKKEDVIKLKSFLNNLSDINELIICCEGGISRSPGLAAAICKYYNLDNTYIWKNRAYHANIHIYKLVCDLLELNYTKEEISNYINMRSKYSTFCGNDRI